MESLHITELEHVNVELLGHAQQFGAESNLLIDESGHGTSDFFCLDAAIESTPLTRCVAIDDVENMGAPRTEELAPLRIDSYRFELHVFPSACDPLIDDPAANRDRCLGLQRSEILELPAIKDTSDIVVA
jgi:hypothetical protein